ncbi:MAG: type II secretion system F family protein [Pseudomonadota bacterium]
MIKVIRASGFSYKQQKLLIDALQQLSVLLKSGLSLSAALAIAKSQYRQPQVLGCLTAMHQAIEHGQSMSSGLRQLPLKLPKGLTGYLDLAEQSGRLPEVLDNLSTEFFQSDQQRKQLRKALQYPLIVLFVAIVVSALLLIWVLPQFTALFVNTQLPALTRYLLAASDWLQHYGLLVLVASTGVITAIIAVKAHLPKLWQRLLLKLPIIGKLLELSRLQQIFLRLSLTLASGMPALSAIEQVKQSSYCYLTQQQLALLQHSIINGEGWCQGFEQLGINHPLIAAYLKTGEQSGLMSDMMKNLANHLEAQLRARSEQLTSLAEPLLMLLLGGIIGLLLLAMYLPIFSMGQHIT